MENEVSDTLVILCLTLPVLFSLFALYMYARLALKVELLQLKINTQSELLDDLVLEIL